MAGKRTGIHGKQSSLFFEAVRIITEMREKTNGQYPRWVVFENVPGAMSSASGLDYRQVLESLVRVKDPEAVIPMPDKGKWLSAGEVMGGNYSLAWRILDAAKGWGVAQRRRRVFIVVDLDGQRAGQVLFESEGVSRYTPPRGQAGQGTAGGAAAGAGETGERGAALALEPGVASREGGHVWEKVSSALRAEMGDNQTCVALDFNPTDSRIKLKEDGICQTLTNRMGTGGNQVPLMLALKAYGICSDQSNSMLSDNPHSGVYEADTSRTLDCSGGSPVCQQGGMAVVQPIAFTQNQRSELRDLHDVAGALSANPGMKQQTFVAAFMGGQDAKAGGLGYQEEMSPTLKSAPSGGNTVPDVVYALQGNMIGRKDENGPQGSGVNENVCFSLNTVDRPAVAAPSYCMTVGSYGQIAKEKTPTLEARGYKDPPVVGKPPESGQSPSYSLDRASFKQGPNAQYGISIEEERAQTLVAQGPNAVALPTSPASYLVRRLTPGECCLLQGYPADWTGNLGTEEPTDEELRWWAGVFVDWYKAQGKNVKPPSEKRLRKWLKDPRTDSAEYKAFGNSVCVNCVFFVLAGIVWADRREKL